ncbi:MAG TPA: glycoside hydrolase family 9 protein [Planctomycetota bacterium]|nr:glycoside hydrolase family 9 protein [Planctomycetota bacterium]
MALASCFTAVTPALAGEADAPERVTPIAVAIKGGSFGDSYTFAGGGCRVVAIDGHVPIEDGGLKIEIAGAGGYWGVGLARGGWVRWYLDDYGPMGALEFEVRGAQGGERFKIGVADSDKDGDAKPDKDFTATVAIAKYAAVTQAWQKVRIPIADLQAAEKNLDLADCIKVIVAQDGNAVPQTIFLKDIRFTTRSPEPLAPPIKLDELGYRPAMRKIAKISKEIKTFQIREAASKKVAFEGKATAGVDHDKASGDSLWECDFSAVNTPGKYLFEAAGPATPEPFEIREDLYDSLFKDLAHFYYLQRCGCALDAKHAGDAWKREACHVGDQKAFTQDGKESRDVSGGWHDAGDCNKYPPFLRYPIFMMLDLYDIRGAALTDGQLNIPESGNGVPDLLDEVQWELDWLLKMQITEGPQAGAVYDRLHQSAAPGGQKAARLQEERRLLPPTAEATAISAACWARCARTFQEIPARQAVAKRYIAAAALALKRLESDKADPKWVLTAAAPLYDATGEAGTLKTLQESFASVLAPLKDDQQKSEQFFWASYDCSVTALACSQRDGDGVRAKARALLKCTADRAVDAGLKDGYNVPLWNTDHYCWSSNNHICRMGYYALMANRFAPRAEYVQMGENALHYMLGRNALAMSLVSGYGTRSTAIYHSIYGGSATAFQPLPAGVVGGGVNQWESRGISAWPAKNYKSDPNNWTLTEPAIYYNAPILFLAGYFAKLEAAAGR